jgi:AraC-like DNA-binding protein
MLLSALFTRLHELLVSGSEQKRINKDIELFIQEIFYLYAGNRPRESSTIYDKMAAPQRHIDDNLQKALNLEKLASQLKLSKFSLIRQFKQYKGITPNEYLTIARVEKSKNMILQGNSLVASAFESGFYDQSHFSRYFLKYTALTPGQFQKGSILRDTQA